MAAAAAAAISLACRPKENFLYPQFKTTVRKSGIYSFAAGLTSLGPPGPWPQSLLSWTPPPCVGNPTAWCQSRDRHAGTWLVTRSRGWSRGHVTGYLSSRDHDHLQYLQHISPLRPSAHRASPLPPLRLFTKPSLARFAGSITASPLPWPSSPLPPAVSVPLRLHPLRISPHLRLVDYPCFCLSAPPALRRPAPPPLRPSAPPPRRPDAPLHTRLFLISPVHLLCLCARGSLHRCFFASPPPPLRPVPLPLCLFTCPPTRLPAHSRSLAPLPGRMTRSRPIINLAERSHQVERDERAGAAQPRLAVHGDMAPASAPRKKRTTTASEGAVQSSKGRSEQALRSTDK